MIQIAYIWCTSLWYEVGIAIQSGDIVWINGPFPAGRYNEIVIFRNKLKDKLEFCKEKVEADDGYRGEGFYIELPQNVGNGGCTQKRKKLLVRTSGLLDMHGITYNCNKVVLFPKISCYYHHYCHYYQFCYFLWKKKKKADMMNFPFISWVPWDIIFKMF